jgi:replicative DNA helicase
MAKLPALPSHDLRDAMPPNDLESEQALLGAMLTKPMVIDDVHRLLTPKDFYEPLYGGLYSTLVEMHAANQRIDARLVVSELKKRKLRSTKNNAAGWTADMLAVVLQSCPTAANAPYYASTVRACAVRRELIYAGMELIRLGHNDAPTAAEAINAAEQQVLAIRDARVGVNDEPHQIAEVLMDVMASIDARSHGQTFGIKSGFPDIDRMCRLRESELVILAARPGMGKTALAMNIATNVAVAEARTVLFVSIEMSALQLGDRLLSAHSGVPHQNMREGRLTTDERRALIKAAGELSPAPLHIEVPHHVQVRDIASSCRRIKRQYGLGLLVIDYLQLINPDYARDSREQQVAKISGQLKQLARELNIPVLCLSQLNRLVENATDKTPKLSHLRESGAIEQDADVVMFIHREGQYMTKQEREADPERAAKAQLTVAKNRNGQTGEATLIFDAPRVRFNSSALAHQMSNYDAGLERFNDDAERNLDSLEIEEPDGDTITARENDGYFPTFGDGSYDG